MEDTSTRASSGPDIITIKLKTYERMRDAEAFLQALYAAGVDSWVGYEEAIRIDQRRKAPF